MQENSIVQRVQFSSAIRVYFFKSSLKFRCVLAVAFQYTINGIPYQVGELSTDEASPDALVLKLLKSTIVDVSLPMWRLLMKKCLFLKSISSE